MKRALVITAVVVLSGCTYGYVDVVQPGGGTALAPVGKIVFQNATTWTDYVTYASEFQVGSASYMGFSIDPSKPQPSAPGANDQQVPAGNTTSPRITSALTVQRSGFPTRSR